MGHCVGKCFIFSYLYIDIDIDIDIIYIYMCVCVYVGNDLEFTNGMFTMSTLANREFFIKFSQFVKNILLSNLVRELAIINITNKNLFQKYLFVLEHHQHSQNVTDQ